MRLRRHRARLFLGGAVAISLAIVGVACSDDSVIPIPLADPFADAGSDPTQKTGSKTKDGAPAPDDPDAGSGADCSAAPILRTTSGAAYYCPFLPRGLDASATDCFNDQTCCTPGKDPSGAFPPAFCAATPLDSKGSTDQSACATQAGSFSSSWPAAGGTTWECADGRNCASGQVCCLFTASGTAAPSKVNIGPDQNKAVPAACNAKQVFKAGGTHCTSTCDPGSEIQTCGADTDCTAPTHCVPFDALGGRDLGYCN
jgi:hypothetical protein